MKTDKLAYKNGGFEISLEDSEKIKLLAGPCYDIMNDCGNYIEMHMIHKTGEEFVFTMQKKVGKTPLQYRKELEDENKKLKQLLKEKENGKAEGSTE